MKKVRVLMEYGYHPVWLYDDEGNIEDTALPPELSGDRELDEKLLSLQRRFDATYVDTPTEFYGRGFATPEEEAALQQQYDAVYIAIGINLEGRKDVLGMWVGENESAKTGCLNSLRRSPCITFYSISASESTK